MGYKVLGKVPRQSFQECAGVDRTGFEFKHRQCDVMRQQAVASLYLVRARTHRLSQQLFSSGKRRAFSQALFS